MQEENQRRQLLDKIQHLEKVDFEAVSLDVFQYQAVYNPIYALYLEYLGVRPRDVQTSQDIPFLPIQLFKQYQLQSGDWKASRVFSSSGTTSAQTSNHLLRDEDWYRMNARCAFAHFYGPITEYCVLALLPAYLERSGSSLVFMADDFIKQSKYDSSGFYLHNYEALVAQLKACEEQQLPTLLIGVSFALWDLAERYPMSLHNTFIMETGGMKGRRKEITRGELHRIFQEAFELPEIHSEYGMTELLSQAYSKGKGIFRTPPSMQVVSREITDPLHREKLGKTGALNIIDLANLETVSFIATDDLGRVYADGSFEVLGRLDASDLRGCNLLLADM